MPNLNTTQESTPNRFFIGLFGVAIVFILISAVLRMLTPPQAPTSEFNSWQNEITPGYTNISEIPDSLGSPISQAETADGTQYSFESTYPPLPHEIVTDPNGTVLFIKEYTPIESTENLLEYITSLGRADFTLKDINSGYSLDAHVYLEEGIVVLAHIADGSVQQKWYFVPTTAEIFLASWGRNLNTEARGPETAPEIYTIEEKDSSLLNDLTL